MFIDKYLNSLYLNIFYDNYDLLYLSTFDESNFLKIYNFLNEKGFYYIDDIILNYFELFEFDESCVRKAFLYLEKLYGKDYIYIIGKNMTVLNKVIDLAIKFSSEN